MKNIKILKSFCKITLFLAERKDTKVIWAPLHQLSVRSDITILKVVQKIVICNAKRHFSFIFSLKIYKCSQTQVWFFSWNIIHLNQVHDFHHLSSLGNLLDGLEMVLAFRITHLFDQIPFLHEDFSLESWKFSTSFFWNH